MNARIQALSPSGGTPTGNSLDFLGTYGGINDNSDFRDDFVLLVYPGEDHGLRKKENQIDYHRRINQWFNHWLKGEPAPKWMTDGMTWAERKSVLDSTK